MVVIWSVVLKLWSCKLKKCVFVDFRIFFDFIQVYCMKIEELGLLRFFSVKFEHFYAKKSFRIPWNIMFSLIYLALNAGHFCDQHVIKEVKRNLLIFSINYAINEQNMFHLHSKQLSKSSCNISNLFSYKISWKCIKNQLLKVSNVWLKITIFFEQMSQTIMSMRAGH